MTLSDKIDVPVNVDFDFLFCVYYITYPSAGGTSSGRTEVCDTAISGFEETIGREIQSVHGYAVTPGFRLAALEEISSFTVSEDTSITLEKRSIIDGVADHLSCNFYTDGTYEFVFANPYTDMFRVAMEQGLLSFVDVKFQFNNAGTYVDYDPTVHSILSDGTDAKVVFKFKSGASTSTEFSKTGFAYTHA